jgi:hypothetical protein
VNTAQAGLKGVCPQCQARFRIPLESCGIPLARLLSLDASWAASLPRAVILPTDHAFLKQEEARTERRRAPLPARSPAPTPSLLPAPTPGLHPLLAAQPDASWCIAMPGGQPSPPRTAAEMQTWLAAGLATGAELVWRSDWADWVSIRLVFPEHLPDA